MNDQVPDQRSEHRRSLLLRPRESFAVEIKSWFDPRDSLGTAKLIKAIFALRNQDGGFLVIGIDDRTLTRITPPRDQPIQEWFHQDNIQQLISKYASQAFEVLVDFENVDDYDYPVISVPAGVVTPVACRADLRSGEQFLLRENEIYVRTLEKNGRISSGKLPWRDVADLVNRCFDNREADHARFLSKLMPGLTTMLSPSIGQATTPSAEDTQKKILERGTQRFNEVAKERKVDVERFGFWDVALQLAQDRLAGPPTRTFYKRCATRIQILLDGRCGSTVQRSMIRAHTHTFSTTHGRLSSIRRGKKDRLAIGATWIFGFWTRREGSFCGAFYKTIWAATMRQRQARQ